MHQSSSSPLAALQFNVRARTKRWRCVVACAEAHGTTRHDHFVVANQQLRLPDTKEVRRLPLRRRLVDLLDLGALRRRGRRGAALRAREAARAGHAEEELADEAAATAETD